MRRSLLAAVTAAALAAALLAAGCAGPEAPAGSVPESASLAPADALAYVRLTTDERSTQWAKADRLLGLFPSSRDDLLAAIRSALSDEGLDWGRDVAPAVGPEVVIVATAERAPILLTRPDDPATLTALLAKQDEATASAEVEGWTAVAERQSDLDAYRAALARGTLATSGSFADAIADLPEEALAWVWVDAAALQRGLQGSASGSGETGGATDAGGLPLGPAQDVLTGTGIDLELDSLTAAVAADDDGMLLSLAVRSSNGADGTRYAPELLARVPGDAIAALSFGGSQGTFDRLRGALGGVSHGLEAFGVSLDRVVDALSGEGVLYVRPGSEKIPEVTLVLSPPDAGKAFATVDDIVRELAADEDAAVRTSTEGGIAVSEVTADRVTLRYAQLDADTVLVTSGPTAIRDFLASGGEKLAATPGFTRAAGRVGLGELTKGFLYIDVDGVIPLVESLAGPGALPPDARDVLGKLDAFILQADGDGTITTLTGFAGVTD